MGTKADNKVTPRRDVQRPTANRLLGVYPQKQEGLFMQRIKIFGGRMSWPQWRKIAQLAIDYTPNTPLHITTRQSIELHNIAGKDVPAIHQGLAEVALSFFGAGGDSLRNITVCSGCGFDPASGDIFPLAQLVGQYLLSQPCLFNLPRKFKISFSGCRIACARPWLNDLGFIAQRDGKFTVIGAGSLGAKPSLGIELYEDLALRDVTPLCVAAIEFFEQSGNRENRRRARFRHVREKLGAQAFKKELDVRFRQLKASQTWPDILPASGNKNIKLLWRLQLPNGNINPTQAIQFADAAELKGAVLRINLEHGLELYGKQTVQLPEILATLESNPIIIACPGSTTCSKGITNTWETADSIRGALAGWHRPETRINISGCPNNCAHSAVADIGLVGMLQKQKGKPVQCYRLFTGGGNGRNDKSAKQSEILCVRDVPGTIKSLVKTQMGRTAQRSVK
jgi:sulfite reductase beta subunit-like hemoprotein